ncbi:MAG: polysaccharide deacetylase family protein [Clostridia bacterium]|nr:polysaccharide deacetylase family protein [Clostridia bacterium]
MKKILSLFLTFILVLSAFPTVFAEGTTEADSCFTLAFSEDFESGTLNSSQWKQTTKTVVEKVEKDQNADNYAARLENIITDNGDGTVTVDASQLNMTKRISVSSRFKYEFSVRIGEIDKVANFPSIYLYQADNKTLLRETVGMLSYSASTGKIVPTIADKSFTTTAGVAVNTNEWIDVCIYVDVASESFTAFVNGNLLKETDGTFVYDLFANATDSEALSTFAQNGGYAAPMTVTSKWMSTTMLYWFDDLKLYNACEGCENCIPTVTISGIEDGDEEIAVKRGFDITFGGEYEDFSISLNGTEATQGEIKANGNGSYTFTPASALDYNTSYTLAAKATNAFGYTAKAQVSFKTKFAYKIFDEDFENGLDTTKWNWRSTKEPAVAEIIDDPKGEKGKVVHMKGIYDTTHSSAQLGNDNLPAGGTNLPGDFVVQFDIMIPESDRNASYLNKALVLLFYTDSATISRMVQVRSFAEDETKFALAFADGLTDAGKPNYITSSVVRNYGEWMNMALVVNPVTDTYEMWIDNQKIGDYKLNGTFGADSLTRFRFQAYSYADGVNEFYLDNIKLAQRLAIVPGADGEYSCFRTSDGYSISQVDRISNIFCPTIVNNGLADEEMTAFLALINPTTHKLEDVVAKSFTVPAGGKYVPEISLDGVASKASKCEIKAILVNNENMVAPYRATFAPASALKLEPNTSANDVSPTYPGGAFKAITMSIDDGFLTDRNMVKILNDNSMKATFHIVGSRADGTSETMAAASIPASEFATLYQGHELANHSYAHFSTVITDEEFEEDLLKSEAIIEATGYSVKGYAYPNGVRGDDTTNYSEILAKNGYLYERADAPWGVPANPLFDAPKAADFISFPITATVGSTSLIGLTGVADKYFAIKEKELSMYSIFTHSHDIGQPNSNWTWDEWAQYCEYIGGRDDVWYATIYDICTYINAVEKMEVTETQIINNSDIDIWCMVNGEVKTVKANDSITIE